MLSRTIESYYFLKLILGSTKIFGLGKELAFASDIPSGSDTYSKAEIDSKLNGKANSSHTHSASQITSGTLSVSRGGTGVTSLSALQNLLGGIKVAEIEITEINNTWQYKSVGFNAKLCLVKQSKVDYLVYLMPGDSKGIMHSSHYTYLSLSSDGSQVGARYQYTVAFPDASFIAIG